MPGVFLVFIAVWTPSSDEQVRTQSQLSNWRQWIELAVAGGACCLAQPSPAPRAPDEDRGGTEQGEQREARFPK